MDLDRISRRARRAGALALVALAGPHNRPRIFRAQGARIGEGCLLWCKDLGTEPYLVSIGDGTAIASDVVFLTHESTTIAIGDDRPRNIFGRIDIGRRCAVGTRSIFLPGSSIGDQCIVGAGTVVGGQFPDRVVVAGVPGKVICTLEEYAEKARTRSLPLTHRNAAELREQLERLLF